MTNWKTIKTALLSSIWTPVVVAILTLVLGIAMSIAQNAVGWAPLLVALAISLIIFLLSLHAVLTKVFPMSIDLIDDLRKEIQRHINPDTITWLMSSEQMAEYERDISVTEIWLVSSDLAEDIPGELFFDVVRENLKRGVRYRYFIPCSLDAEARAKQIMENHRQSGDIVVTPLTDDFFFLVPRFDFAIYDPFNKVGKRSGYMGLPIDTDGRHHAKLDSHFVDLLIGKLQSLSPNSSSKT